MAAKSAWLKGAERVIIVDALPYRLAKAKDAAFADAVLWGNEGAKEVVEQIRALTEGRWADLCVDAVGFESDRSLLDKAKSVVNLEKGSPKVLEACMSAVRRGGVVSVLGLSDHTIFSCAGKNLRNCPCRTAKRQKAKPLDVVYFPLNKRIGF